jgi:hypothetical protein
MSRAQQVQRDLCSVTHQLTLPPPPPPPLYSSAKKHHPWPTDAALHHHLSLDISQMMFTSRTVVITWAQQVTPPRDFSLRKSNPVLFQVKPQVLRLFSAHNVILGPQDVAATISAVFNAAPWSRVFVLYCVQRVHEQEQALQQVVELSSCKGVAVTLVPVAASCFAAAGGSSAFLCAAAFAADWDKWLPFTASASAALIIPPSTLVTRHDVIRLCGQSHPPRTPPRFLHLFNPRPITRAIFATPNCFDCS